MSKKTIVIISVVVNLILLSLVIYYKKEDKRYISKVTEKDNISMLKIVGEETEVIKQVPQSGQWSMSYTCDDENAELYWNEKKRTVVAKNISATECTLIFRESDAIFRMISMYVDGEYVTELDNTKMYEIESYECSNGEELTWDFQNSKLSIQPISKDTSCYVNFNEKYFTLTETMLAAEEAQSDVNIDFAYTSEGCSESTYNSSTKEYECSSYNATQVTNGLYYTSDLTKTEGGKVVYYYRGAVENNYVIFGTHQTEIKEVRGYYSSTNFDYGSYDTMQECNMTSKYSYNCTEFSIASKDMPICWRIVRTVEDGSVRLRYGGAAVLDGEKYTCPQTAEDIKIGFSYYSYHQNYKTSLVKPIVENWYRDNIAPNTSLANLVEDTPYCNDLRSSLLYDETLIGYDRISVYKNPQYKCEYSAYGYTVAKGDLTYPIGLLTADEAAYAGGVYNVGNSSFYLNTLKPYLTMTPQYPYLIDDDAVIFTVGEIYASISYYSTNTNLKNSFVLPVISLKNEAKVKSGTGLYNDPYIIKTN